MTEWKKYTGSPEQIEELIDASKLNGFIARNAEKEEKLFINTHFYYLNKEVETDRKIIDANMAFYSEYLICNQHPLADMIFQQASTGQEVYIKITLCDLDFHISRLIEFFRFVDPGIDWHKVGQFEPGERVIFKTTKPDWNIPGAQYSFTPFED